MTPRKYANWGEFLRKIRSAKYRSAREFCLKAGLGISYPQYSRYEAGEQLPTLELAIHLFSLLEVPVLIGLLEWNRAQIQEASALAKIDALITQLGSSNGSDTGLQGGGPTPPSEPAQIPLDDLFVFNRSHLRLFTSDPVYRDIFTYINSYSPDVITSEELADVFGMDPDRLRHMLQDLYDHGVIARSGEGYAAAKRNYYFPEDEDFFELRNQNLRRNMDVILKDVTFDGLTSKKAYRSLVTRELTADQFDWMIRRADELLSEAVHLPETGRPDKIYSICLLMGARFTRPARYMSGSVATGEPQVSPGLRTGIQKEISESTNDQQGESSG